MTGGYVGTVRLEIHHGVADLPPELTRALEVLGYRPTHVPGALTVDVDRAHAVRVLAVLLDQIITTTEARAP